MAKKRKLNSKSSSETLTPQKKQQKQQQKKQQQQQQQQQEPVEEPVEEVEEESEESEEEEEEESEEEFEEENDDDEPIEKLLEPFSKEQLITLLIKASESHSDVLSEVKKVADMDPVHRKIFVHGLGWDATADTLRNSFSQYGEIEDCKAVIDKITGKSKGYGFILFKTRSGAYKALKEPQKKIGNRMTSCQLAAVGPVSGSTSAVGNTPPVSEYTQRKIYVSNVSADLDPQKVASFFAKYGEIEEGPMGLDKQTGKFKGFCLFVYKSAEGARMALEEAHKNFEGHILHCQRAIDGPKMGKQVQNQARGPQFGRKDNPNSVGSGAVYNQPGVGGGVQGLNPALGQALTALLASQGAGFGLNNLLGSLGGGIGAGGSGVGQGGYGSQGVGVAGASGINPSGVIGGYGAQGAYPNQQIGQGGSGSGSGRSQHGYMGGVAPYGGH